jgi:hypothetical protein
VVPKPLNSSTILVNHRKQPSEVVVIVGYRNFFRVGNGLYANERLISVGGNECVGQSGLQVTAFEARFISWNRLCSKRFDARNRKRRFYCRFDLRVCVISANDFRYRVLVIVTPNPDSPLDAVFKRRQRVSVAVVGFFIGPSIGIK